MKPTLLIMAAGMGSRYGGLKQLDPIGPSGETIMDYSVYDAIKAGFGKIVFVIRKSFEADFHDKVLRKYQGRIETSVVFQSLDALPDGFAAPANREKPWGTGHAVLMGKDAVNEPFLVINADDFYGFDTFRLGAEFLRAAKEGEYCMIGFKIGNTLSEAGAVSRGICEVGDDGYLKKVIERKEIRRDGGAIVFKDESGALQHIREDAVVSMNAWGLGRDYFDRSFDYFKNVFLPRGIDDSKSEFFIPSMIDYLIGNNLAKVKCLGTNAEWFGVTYKEDKDKAVAKMAELISAGAYPGKLFD